ncbi:MAG: DUF805 domain-containing protein [Prevotella sp.]|nr:DUF805 domain-containing protein [Prevotella sp.]
MSNLKARPALGFREAVSLGFKQLFVLNGRSRRSEFWWFMLSFIIIDWILSIILSFAPMTVSTVLSCLIGLLLVPITIRRLQDGGHSKWWVIIGWVAALVYTIYSYAGGLYEVLNTVNPNPSEITRLFTDPVLIIAGLISFCTGIPTFIFCLLDGKPESNKYGESPKYYTDDAPISAE